MATLKTPGVYVQEISKFPPSVAPVSTAIPAFIGYTEKATELTTGDLNMTPKRISSMLEYEQYFGFAENEGDINVDVTSSGAIIVSVDSPSDYKMYYSMQMYFANGGGPCYIVSVGSYSEAITIGTSTTGLTGGLGAIRKEDEPTLLLYPDNQALVDTDFYALYDATLAQCHDLQDRFAIMDTYGDGSTAITNFRDNTRSEKDYVKYGAAYYPFLDTILDYRYVDAAVDVEVGVEVNGASQVQAIIDTFSTSSLVTLIGELATLENDAATASPASDGFDMKPDIIAKVNQIKAYLVSVQAQLNSAVSIGREETDSGVVTATNNLDAWITSDVEAKILALNTRLDELNASTSRSGMVTVITANIYPDLGYTGTPATATLVTDLDAQTSSGGELYDLEDELDDLPTASSTSYTLAELETADNDLYNKVKAAIADFPVTLAPSSAMAGVYARVDNAVGVWKAPANVTVQYVQQPTVRISNEDQEDMNVTSSGKSVNAIRTFTGKGTLAWGARTLAGNDNEWRYISVRRFFNFVEESVSEATEQFVFEPNTANTWVRVRGLIESFLLQQWKAGALAGAKPEDAYYVRIGLGQTMTSQDVLEGRMIVEIGMAAVRPAEFIVLKFSHKMQEA